MTDEIELTGVSGRSYVYRIHEWPAEGLQAGSGNYAFAVEVAAGQFRLLYVGQSGDLSQCLGPHHRAACVEKNGATHILLRHHDGSEEMRAWRRRI